MSTRGLAASLVVIGFVSLPAGVAQAGSAGVTDKEHEFKAVNVLEHIGNPCTGVPGTLTEVENGVFQLKAAGLDADGNPLVPYTSTLNVENSFTFVPDGPGAPSYTGHSHTHISDRFRQLPGVEQFANSIQAIGSDGSRLRVHETARAMIAADGSMTIVFDHASCISG